MGKGKAGRRKPGGGWQAGRGDIAQPSSANRQACVHAPNSQTLPFPHLFTHLSALLTMNTSSVVLPGLSSTLSLRTLVLLPSAARSCVHCSKERGEGGWAVYEQAS